MQNYNTLQVVCSTPLTIWLFLPAISWQEVVFSSDVYRWRSVCDDATARMGQLVESILLSAANYYSFCWLCGQYIQENIRASFTLQVILCTINNPATVIICFVTLPWKSFWGFSRRKRWVKADGGTTSKCERRHVNKQETKTFLWFSPDQN